MTMKTCPRTKIPRKYRTCVVHQRIGGTLDYAALTRHRPTYRSGMEQAARDLAARGLRSHDIAAALGIGTDDPAALAAVRQGDDWRRNLRSSMRLSCNWPNMTKPLFLTCCPMRN